MYLAVKSKCKFNVQIYFALKLTCVLRGSPLRSQCINGLGFPAATQLQRSSELISTSESLITWSHSGWATHTDSYNYWPLLYELHFLYKELLLYIPWGWGCVVECGEGGWVPQYKAGGLLTSKEAKKDWDLWVNLCFNCDCLWLYYFKIITQQGQATGKFTKVVC